MFNSLVENTKNFPLHSDKIIVNALRLVDLPNRLLYPIPTRLCHIIYCCGYKRYPCLVGIGLTNK